MMMPDTILTFLDEARCKYELIRHPPEGETIAASNLRGHPLRQAAKSLVLEASQRRNSIKSYYLAVAPGHKRVDLKLLKCILGVRRLQFAPEYKATELTGCVMGAVPPLSFNSEMEVVLDLELLSNSRLVFNAGVLDLSVSIPADEYMRVLGSHIGFHARVPSTAEEVA